MSKLIATILLIPGILLLIVGSMVLRGWVLSLLWLWFLVPLGLPYIGIAHAIGISGIVTLLTLHQDTHEESRKVDWGKVVGALLAPLVLLFIGYVIHGFM